MRRIVVAALLASVAGTATASADTLVVAAPGARNLASGGGWLAWAAPVANDRWRLVLRSPDGAIVTPPIRSFARAPDPSIGTTSLRFAEARLAVVYARDDGDVHQLDVRTLRERPVRAINTAAVETAPSLATGRYAFVRRSGPRRGVFVTSPSGAVRRVARTVARETAASTSRVAYTDGSRVRVRRMSGRGRAFSVSGGGTAPRSIVLSRYHLAFLTSGGRVWWTPRFGGSGPTEVRAPRPANRALPAATTALALANARPRLYLDAQGIHRIDPPLFLAG